MDRLTRFWLLLILVMLPGFTEAAPPETISALQNLQIHANRATSSLLLYRGEGFQKAHLLRLEDDIRALNAALLNVANPTSALRESHQALQAQQGADAQAELPAKVEYLAVQYLSRAYIGSFEIAREQPDTYLGQDERHLVPAIDAQLAELDGKRDPALAKLKTRWDFLKVALEDMNSGSNNFTTASGRPFAPIMVDRHARSLSDQWMAAKP